MKPKPDSGKAKNLGSPLDATQRSVRTAYGRAVAASSRDASTKKRVASVANATGRGGSEGPKRGMTAGRSMGAGAGSEGPKKRAPKYGPTGGAQPGSTKAPKSSGSKVDRQMIQDSKALRVKLRGVDYNAVGRLMAAKGSGKLPKTK